MDDEVRRAYAARSAEYVAAIGSVAAMSPLDVALIDLWARDVDGPVVDAGCGPGHWTAFLHERGLDVEGVDMVPEFLAGARERFPDVRFRLGNLDDLEVPDGALGGVLAWYSLIHTPPEHLGARLREIARCVRPGGSLLLGFFPGEVVEPFDHTVVGAYFWPPEAMRRELAAAGFEVTATHTRAETASRRMHAAIAARRA